MSTTCVPLPPRRRRVRAARARRPAAPEEQEILLHGQRVTYLEAGRDHAGPVIVLLHGLASSSTTWAPVMPELGRRARVIAPDLLGHGRSAKPHNGDYSLGAYATGLRDLMLALDIDRATIGGHSFGGGVAMQFAYQFPEFTERLVLVASGGLGPEVSIALRAAALPLAATVLHATSVLTPRWLTRLIRRAAAAIPPLATPDLDGLLSAFASFADSGARNAFVHTTRSALDWSGQRLTGTERLPLLADVPVLLIGGSRDPVIPIAHTVAAHPLLRASALHVFDEAGHFPHVERPDRFAELLTEFVAGTPAARSDRDSLRSRLSGTSA